MRLETRVAPEAVGQFENGVHTVDIFPAEVQGHIREVQPRRDP